jgi:hypothetical protein
MIKLRRITLSSRKRTQHTRLQPNTTTDKCVRCKNRRKRTWRCCSNHLTGLQTANSCYKRLTPKKWAPHSRSFSIDSTRQSRPRKTRQNSRWGNSRLPSKISTRNLRWPPLLTWVLMTVARMGQLKISHRKATSTISRSIKNNIKNSSITSWKTTIPKHTEVMIGKRHR